MLLILKVSSFNDGDFIDKKFTCDGDDTSPSLFWSDQSSKTKFYVIIVDDPYVPLELWLTE